jgi:hypothetical protein
MNDDLEAFFQDGLTKFPEAYKATETFANEFSVKLETIMSAGQWKRLALASKRTATTARYGGDVSRGIWVYAYCRTTLLSKPIALKLEVGMWWGCPEIGEPLIAYLGCSEGPESLCRLDRNPPSSSAVKREKLMGQFRYYLPLQAGHCDILVAFTALLEEFDAVAGALDGELQTEVVGTDGPDTLGTKSE